MLLERGDRRFDLTHRMLVLGVADDDGIVAERWVDAGVDGLVVRSSSEAEAVCDRVDVPVGVQVSRTSAPFDVEFSPGVAVSAVGPLVERGAARIGRLTSAIIAGRRAVLVIEAETVRADRRVAAVMERLLSARADVAGTASR